MNCCTGKRPQSAPFIPFSMVRVETKSIRYNFQFADPQKNRSTPGKKSAPRRDRFGSTHSIALEAALPRMPAATNAGNSIGRSRGLFRKSASKPPRWQQFAKLPNMLCCARHPGSRPIFATHAILHGAEKITQTPGAFDRTLAGIAHRWVNCRVSWIHA